MSALCDVSGVGRRLPLAMIAVFVVARCVLAVGPIVDVDGFEGFTLGAVEEQQGWLAAGFGFSSATVQSAVVHSGSRAVAVQRAPNSDRRWATPVSGFPTGRFITVDWQMRVMPTGASGVFGPFLGVETYDGSPTIAVLGTLGVDATTGDVLYQAADGPLAETGVKAAFNQWNRFRIVLDFVNHNYSVFFNGARLSPSPIELVDHSAANPLNEFSDADIAALAAAGDPGSAAQAGTAYFDDFSVFDGVPGDFDVNGIVNGADLAVWRSAMGLSSAGDADGDADTDGADFLIWQRELQGAAGGVAAVPESASIAMLLVGVPLLRLKRRLNC